jgi:uncharacterized Fe-S cluster-containing MiaB family protein
MFIDEVVKKIWEDVSEEYRIAYNNAIKMDADELYRSVLGEVKIGYFEGNGINMNTFATSGCPHNNRNGVFSGCSMCDFYSEHAGILAKMSALKQKNTRIYAKAIRASFENVRGKDAIPNAFELISGYDSLNDEEMPDDVFEEVFVNSIYKRQPYQYIFETRASSVSLGKLNKVKSKLGPRVSVEVGVEVGNEWLRNHWINKNTSDEQIINAFNIIAQAGCEGIPNVLIGVPGLTEEQSIRIFCDTIKWLDSLGIKKFLCSPLSRRRKTLQAFLYDHLRENKRLMDIGVARGELTAIPSGYTVLKAVYEMVNENPQFSKRLIISETNTDKYIRSVDPSHHVVSEINKILQQYEEKDVSKALGEILNKLKSDLRYAEPDKEQYGIEKLADTLKAVAEEVAKILWPSAWEGMVRLFHEELLLFC